MKTPFNFWPFGIVLLLVTFFIGIMTLVVIASSQHFDLVNENYYADELKYQNQIDSLERARVAGASVRFDAARRRLLVALGTPAGSVTEPVRLKFYRPAAAGLDQEITVQPGTDGQTALETSGLKPGLWKVRVSWSAAGKPLLLEGTFTNLAAAADGQHPK